MIRDDFKSFLLLQLKRENLPTHYRDSIEGTINFINEENENSKKVWGDFLAIIQTKVDFWQETYSVPTYHYEFYSFQEHNFNRASLKLKSNSHSTWVFEIQVGLENGRIYFSSVGDEADETEVSSFNELETLIDTTFESKSFQTFLTSLEKYVQQKQAEN